MEDKMPDKIDYIIHETMMARQERHIKRLWILCLIIFAAFVATNVGWILYESQWTDEVITQEVTQDSIVGSNSYSGTIVGGDYNGETNGENDNKETGA